MSLHCPPAQYQLDPTDDDLCLEPSTSYSHSRSLSATTRRKAKPERACDLCRRRKTKCDGPLMSNGVCTSCQQNKQNCTYVETSKPRGPPKAYITALEDRMEKMEALLTRLRPETDLVAELGPAVVRDSWKDGDDVQEKSRSPARGQRAGSDTSRKATKTILPPCLPIDRDANMSDVSDDSDDIVLHGPLSGKTQKLPTVASPVASPTDKPDIQSLPIVDAGHGFFGKSSTIMLVDAAWQLKDAHAHDMRRPHSLGIASDQDTPARSVSFRNEFWETPEWEMNCMDSVASASEASSLSYILALFPSDDLAASLIDLFFARVNIQWPYLHRPTFERQWHQGLQERDVWFAFLCAAVFAVASRYSDDENVLPGNGSPPPAGYEHTKWQSAGWHWFEAVLHFAKSRIDFASPTSLFEVQTLITLCEYMIGTEFEAAAWLYISIGLRMIQEVGAHRQQMYTRGSNQIEEELWRRAFWVLIVHDRLLSAYLGRDCSAREEDFDVHLPTEVDDEFWEASGTNPAFTQPIGRPSLVAGFNAMARLSQLAAFAVRTGCTTEKVHKLGDQDSDSRTAAMKELNTAFTEWAKTLPAHLRFSSTMKNTVFFHQSAQLFALYYGLQILIYRPFVAPACTWTLPSCATSQACTSPERHAHPHIGFPFPASAICRTAARAFSHFAVDLVQSEMQVTPMLLAVAQVSAAVMVSHAWEVKVRNIAAGVPEETARYAVENAVGEARTVMHIFEVAQGRWAKAGIVLQKLSSSLPSPEDELRIPYPSPSEIHPPSSGSSENSELSPNILAPSSASSQVWTPSLSSHATTVGSNESIKIEPNFEDTYLRHEYQDQKWDLPTSAVSYTDSSPYIETSGDSKDPRGYYQSATYPTPLVDADMHAYPPRLMGQGPYKRARTSTDYGHDFQAYDEYGEAAPPYLHHTLPSSIVLPSPANMAHLEFGFDTRRASSHAEHAWASPYDDSRGYANSHGYTSDADPLGGGMATYHDVMMDGSTYYGY